MDDVAVEQLLKKWNPEHALYLKTRMESLTTNQVVDILKRASVRGCSDVVDFIIGERFKKGVIPPFNTSVYDIVFVNVCTGPFNLHKYDREAYNEILQRRLAMMRRLITMKDVDTQRGFNCAYAVREYRMALGILKRSGSVHVQGHRFLPYLMNFHIKGGQYTCKLCKLDPFERLSTWYAMFLCSRKKRMAVQYNVTYKMCCKDISRLMAGFVGACDSTS